MKTTSWALLLLVPLVIMATENWMLTWILMEMATMPFIFLMMKMKGVKEEPMKYFLVQSLGSMFLLVGILMKSKTNPTSEILSLSKSETLIMLALALKSGVAPLHMWLSPVSKNMPWSMLTSLLTIQKAAPIYLMSANSTSSVLPMMALMSSIVGTISQLNMNNIKMIITFSSIAHMGWIVSLMSQGEKIPMIYLIMYSIVLILVVLQAKKTNKKLLSEQTNKNESTLMLIALVSLAGLPPLAGFVPKWMAVNTLLHMEFPKTLILIMIFMAAINVWVYIKIMSNKITMPPMSTTKWNNNLEKKEASKSIVTQISMTPIMMITLWKSMT